MDNSHNHDHHDHGHTSGQGALEQMISKEVSNQISNAGTLLVRSAVASTLVTAASALRQQMYGLIPVTAQDYLVPPEPLETATNDGMDPYVGVVLTKRLFITPGCFLLTVLYQENKRYKATVTTFNEDDLSKNSNVVLPESAMREIDRQLKQITAMDFGCIAHFGLFIMQNFFNAESAAPASAAPATAPAEEQNVDPAPVQREQAIPTRKVTQLPGVRPLGKVPAARNEERNEHARSSVDRLGLPVRPTR